MEQAPGRTCDFMRTHTGAVNEEMQTMGRTHSAVLELFPVGGTSCWSREECEEEEASEIMCDKEIATLIPSSQSELRNVGVKLPQEEGRSGRNVLFLITVL